MTRALRVGLSAAVVFVVLGEPVGLAWTADSALGSKPFDKGRRCEFDPSALTLEELNTKLTGPMGPWDRAICGGQALRDGDPKKRAVGLRVLAGKEGPLAGALMVLVREMEEGGQSAETAEETGRKIALVVIPFLKDGRLDIPARAASLLGRVGDPIAVLPLGQKLADPDPNIRGAVVDALREIHDPSTLEPLARAMRDPSLNIASTALGGVKAIGGPGAVDALIGLLWDRKVDRSIRQSAAFSLRGLGDPKGVAAANRYLRSQGVQWQRIFYVTPLLYLVGFLGSRREAAGERGAWRKRTYAAAAVGIFALVGLHLFPSGLGAELYWLIVLLYPVVFAAGAAGLGEVIRRRGAGAVAEEFVRRMLVSAGVMWGAVATWMALGYVLLIIGMSRAWR